MMNVALLGTRSVTINSRILKDFNIFRLFDDLERHGVRFNAVRSQRHFVRISFLGNCGEVDVPKMSNWQPILGFHDPAKDAGDVN